MGAFDLIFGAKQRVRIGIGASDEFLPIGAVELDASLNENHTASNQITRFPVERGVDITDHIRKQPDRVSITGVITDHPIHLGGAAGNPNRSGDAYGAFLDMINGAQLVAVVTTLRTYFNMGIESMVVPRDVSRGNSIEVTLNFVEVNTAQVIRDQATTDLGSQNVTPIAA